jgi:hypothetical protein
MKEQTLLEMKNKVDALSNVMKHLYNDINNLRELAVGTLETLKLIDGYDTAIETLKTNIKENAEKTEEETKEKVLEL